MAGRTAAAPATSAPFRFADLHVTATTRISPSMIRVTFGGTQLAGLTGGGRDQRVKLFLPHPYQDTPVVPLEAGDSWYAAWRDLDPAVRAVMRTYTVREQRRGPDELDIDFALHGHGGPASRWAARAQAGDRVAVLGPVVADNGGVDFRPPPGTNWVLLTADPTALPAVAGILAWLPAGMRALVWIEVPDAGDIRDLPTRANAEITWLVRDHLALEAVREADLPPGNGYAWVAGESSAVRALRHHLVHDRALPRERVTFTGYWRQGATEEDLLATG